MNDALEEDEGGYYILLNKFALVRGHFLMVTKGMFLSLLSSIIYSLLLIGE
jgi:hypothetical protein